MSGCPDFLRDFPGAVLAVSAEGVVTESNGQLERDLGRPLVGRPLADALDPASSLDKWERLRSGDPPRGAVWELIFRAVGETPAEPRAFSAARDPDSPGFWLIEHPRDPRLERLATEVNEVNSELALTQRELSKEKARLSQVLRELEVRQRELERRNRELDEFARVVSHDLKAPLRGIAAYARFLREDAGDALDGEAREHLENLCQRADRMGALIDGILAYARAGRDGVDVAEVAVDDLLAEVVDLLGPPAGARVEAEPGIPPLRTERTQLAQVFLNLIGNALKHAARPDPVVRVAARDLGDLVEFHVADNGPGIPPRIRDRIWGIFYTGPGSTDSTGIGLAVVKKLVENHGGSIRVESEVGSGSTFVFTWPKGPSGSRTRSLE